VNLLTGYDDVCVRAEVIDWHAIIAKGQSKYEVIDEATLTIEDLETSLDDLQHGE
jgi:hypothetical protein